MFLEAIEHNAARLARVSSELWCRRCSQGTIARLIVLYELTLSVLLPSGVYSRYTFFAAAFLLVVFALAVAINLMRGRIFDCGCSTLSVDTAISWSHVGANLALATGAVVAAFAAPTLRPPTIPALILMTAGAALAAIFASDLKLRRLARQSGITDLSQLRQEVA